jgi:hypothetical protein
MFIPIICMQPSITSQSVEMRINSSGQPPRQVSQPPVSSVKSESSSHSNNFLHSVFSPLLNLSSLPASSARSSSFVQSVTTALSNSSGYSVPSANSSSSVHRDHSIQSDRMSSDRLESSRSFSDDFLANNWIVREAEKFQRLCGEWDRILSQSLKPR